MISTMCHASRSIISVFIPLSGGDCCPACCRVYCYRDILIEVVSSFLLCAIYVSGFSHLSNPITQTHGFAFQLYKSCCLLGIVESHNAFIAPNESV